MNTFELENRVRQQEQETHQQVTQERLARVARQNQKPGRKFISTAGGFTQLMLALMR
jgi:hypothetical protein